MGKEYLSIDAAMQDWIKQQKIFFVVTAPLCSNGMVNCSPKGMDTFGIIDEHTIAYLDLTGSGIETVAHLKENGRVVIMFCAFEGAPRIFRFHGKGSVLEKGSLDYEKLIDCFIEIPGARAIIKIDVERISDSCGYSVPLYNYVSDRDVLIKWTEKKESQEGVEKYQERENGFSLDGLPGLKSREQNDQ